MNYYSFSILFPGSYFLYEALAENVATVPLGGIVLFKALSQSLLHVIPQRCQEMILLP